MNRQQLLIKNNSLFSKYLSESRNTFNKTRNAQLTASVVPAVITAAKIAAGTAAAAALAPGAVIGAFAVAAGGYAAYKLNLDKAIISASLRMADKVKSLFTLQAKNIQNKAEISETATIGEEKTQKEATPQKNETFERMDLIVAAHNRGDKFDSQTGEKLGASPIEDFKKEGVSEADIQSWKERNIPNQSKRSHLMKGVVAMTEDIDIKNTSVIEATKKLEAGGSNKPKGLTLQ